MKHGNGQRKAKSGERLDALEAAATSQGELLGATAKRTGEMEMILFNISRENEILKDALQLMHEKLDAVVSLSNNADLSDENINKQITEQKVENLKKGIDNGLEKGNIKATDVVGKNSLIVSRELDKDGEVENPRLQFMVGRLAPELAGNFVGKVVGDLIVGVEDRLDVEIMEIYDFVEQSIGEDKSLPETKAEEPAIISVDKE